jgi:alkylhydroperoxidase family enzyme
VPRIKEITQAGGDPILEAEFASEQALFGGVINPSKVMAHCPPILRAAKKLYAAFDESGQLPTPLLALAYVRVASINGCPF